MVIWRRAGTVVIAPFSPATATMVLAYAGMKRLTGSFRPILPSSTSARTPTLVIALVCEAMRKIVSVVIRRFASLSAQPTAFS